MAGLVIPIRKKTDSLSRLKAAGLGHGTFYLHYPDKRACFLAFVEEARQELNEYVAKTRNPAGTLEERVGATLNAIYDYSDLHPGVLRAAMTDEMVIDAEGAQATPLLERWGEEWATLVREAAGQGLACKSYNADIIGQAIVGALHQTSLNSSRGQRCRVAMVDNLTRFLTKALKTD
jgi:AcrR family transcriptional regulator